MMIEFSSFSFTYKGLKKPVLKNINLKIEDGEKVLILGPSGSGKSTLGNVINGLIPHAIEGKCEGSVTVEGLDVLKNDIYKINEKVGTVLQDTDSQFVGLTVSEDVAFALENMRKKKDEMEEKTMEALSLVSMQDYASSSPQDLSGGQKQRVSLAGVLVEENNVLLFDEPLANLDPATGKKTIRLIDEIHEKTGKTVIIIEHRLEDVLEMHIDRAVMIVSGEIVYNGSMNDLLKSSLLKENGIRYPLYLEAMNRARCALENECVESLSSINPSCYREKVKAWFEENREKEEKEERPVLLEVENISYSYDGIKNAVSDISFKIHEGEMLSILGNNGAGKSTLSSILMGIYKPDKGRILYRGKDITAYSISQKSSIIGYVMQNPNHMISQTKVFDEVAFGLRTRGVEEDDVKNTVSSVLTLCGLEKKANWPVSSLSYGQKKRVTIASILVMKPEVLILDEPTAGQDYHHYTMMMEFITALSKRLNLAIIFVTHDMHLALEYTPRSIVLSSSRLIKDDDTSAVFSDEDVLKRASLKETSLFSLAKNAGLDENAFIRAFIESEKKEREKNLFDRVPQIEIPDNIRVDRVKKKKKKYDEGERKIKFGLSYIPLESRIHSLSGLTKFIYIFFGAFVSFTTFDLRILSVMLVLSWTLVCLTKIPLKIFRPYLILMSVMTITNDIFIYLFSPNQGTIYMATRTVLLGPETFFYSLTLETLWYLLIVTCKYLILFPLALMFISTTHPGEFASSINRLGISYKISYATSLSLRYLPDVIKEYTHISNAQMARGVDLSSNVGPIKRAKGVASALAPLVMFSLDKIDTISNAMALRGFGRSRKRTWYSAKKLKAADWALIIFLFALWALALYMRFGMGIKFWKPF